MKQGVLVYDQKSERMDVRFGLEDYYGGLHCGTCMDVFVNNRWKPTRIEYGWDERGWYLVGVPTPFPCGIAGSSGVTAGVHQQSNKTT